jgi:hypothetical protein
MHRAHAHNGDAQHEPPSHFGRVYSDKNESFIADLGYENQSKRLYQPLPKIAFLLFDDLSRSTV